MMTAALGSIWVLIAVACNVSSGGACGPISVPAQFHNQDECSVAALALVSGNPTYVGIKATCVQASSPMVPR